jgi:soluble lytic murein transglycosylase-like protein
MYGARRAIFPGIIIGSLAIIFLTGMVARPLSLVEAQNKSLSAVEFSQQNADQSAQPAQPADMQDAIPCTLPGNFPASVRQWCAVIESSAQQNGLEAKLIASVMLQESVGDAQAVSRSGAIGLMQVMPRDGQAATFMCINGPCFADRPSMQELFEPHFNVAYGSQLLAGLIQTNGSVREGLRAYGPRDSGYTYADLVLQHYNNY